MPPHTHTVRMSQLWRHETVLLLVLALEWFYFHSVGRHFGSLDNTFDILRHSVEMGVLALVMAPIILSGVVDVSVGSSPALAAIVVGRLWREAGLSLWAAGMSTVGLAALAGGFNAAMITWLRLPPLIVTLG